MPINAGRSDEHDAEYTALLKQIRFSEYAATCARSGILQATAGELRSIARRLVRESLALRGTAVVTRRF